MICSWMPGCPERSGCCASTSTGTTIGCGKRFVLFVPLFVSANTTLSWVTFGRYLFPMSRILFGLDLNSEIYILGRPLRRFDRWRARRDINFSAQILEE